jgi:NDP-sugar pyrophosphorylase family protein
MGSGSAWIHRGINITLNHYGKTIRHLGRYGRYENKCYYEEYYTKPKDELLSIILKPVEKLAKEGQLIAYKHFKFWKCMDTQSDKGYLENVWKEGKAPWKAWRD